MNRPLFATCLAGAGLAGIVFGQIASKNIPLRNELGILCSRGKLLALADGHGIYEADVLRAQKETSYASGAALSIKPERQIPPRLIVNMSIQRWAWLASIPPARIDREYRILRAQLRDEAAWDATLRTNHFSRRTFRAEVAKNARIEAEIERRLIEPTTEITDGPSRLLFGINAAKFRLPTRFRARHLFFAAPPESPPEVVDAKQRAIEIAATRLAHGEDFAVMAALLSEDEFTKNRGGGLGSFSEHRMPVDFMAAIKSMRVGERSGVVRTQLGFHIIELIEIRPPRQMDYDEVEGEIGLDLECARRRQWCAKTAHELAGEAIFIQSPDRTD